MAGDDLTVEAAKAVVPYPVGAVETLCLRVRCIYHARAHDT